MAESNIEGALVNFVGEKLLECVTEPIKRWYNYLRCFNSNVEKLREEERKLIDARDGLHMRVDRAKNNAEVILPQVNTWLEKTDKVLASMVEIEGEITDMQSVWLTRTFYRFSLSKKVKKKTEAMEQLLGDCNFDVISQPAPPASMVPTPSRPTKEFESRKNIEEDVMSTLRDEKVSMMGICGMGGVGKTTMAKRIKKRVMEEHLFDETVMVVVSQQVNMLKIQLEIAEQLRLTLDEKTLSARAHKLRTRLAGGKRILIVIDDVWKNLKLEDLGIPCESDFKGCTILLTSRDRGVLNEMGAQKVCEIQTLSEFEAWSLFQEKVGRCVDDQNLLAIAQEVLKECKGLPIAIVNVAAALKDVKYKFCWDDALEQLKSSDPTDMPKVLEDVYKPLKLSYDFLGIQHAKSIFLLCCLFPEDRNIPLEDLTLYAMGLCMYERTRNLEQVRNRTYSLVEMLKSRFLLLEGRDQYHVRMHDVIRDVAIFIASEERRIKKSDCTWISPYLEEGIELSLEQVFPNLRLLWINKSAVEELQISDNFFERMTKLNVLSLRNDSLRSLPHSTKLLKNLRTLILYLCGSLENISVVGELVNIEILICRYCNIKELPAEIGRLHRMRLLDLSCCRELKTIAPGVISSLVGLEELKMVESFNKWEAKDNKGEKRKNAGLRELESLSNLTCLQIEVEDFALVAEEIRLSQKIVNFGIIIGDRYCFGSFESGMGLEKRMDLCLTTEITIGNWILKFLSSFEHMRLVGEGLTNLELEHRALQNLRSLTVRQCSTMKKLRNTFFPLLESLRLEKLISLEEICNADGPIPDEGSTSNIVFKNLKDLELLQLPALKHFWKSSPYQNNVVSLFNSLSAIYLYECDGLRNLFSLSMSAKDCLLQLKSLIIVKCKMMEQVFLWNEEENERNDIGSESHCDRHIKIFPKLETLKLHNLPSLTTFCKGIERIEFPLLTQMEINNCPKLKSLVSNTPFSNGCGINLNNLGGINHDHGDDDSLHLFCKPEELAFGSVSWVLRISTLTLWCHHIPISFFTGLEDLDMFECNKIKSLFSSSIAENLFNLKKLKIQRCKKMVKVIDDKEDEDACPQTTTCLFPTLEFLQLWWLYKLEMFCGWRLCALELPSLKTVDIFQCPKIERFSFASLTTPNLEQITRRRRSVGNASGQFDFPEIIINSKDLNDGVQQLLFTVKDQEGEERWRQINEGI